MSGQAHLLQLVDLSFGHPEVGAVNFNHLRTLLLGIVKVFPSSGENSDELQQVEKVKIIFEFFLNFSNTILLQVDSKV